MLPVQNKHPFVPSSKSFLCVGAYPPSNMNPPIQHSGHPPPVSNQPAVSGQQPHYEHAPGGPPPQDGTHPYPMGGHLAQQHPGGPPNQHPQPPHSVAPHIGPPGPSGIPVQHSGAVDSYSTDNIPSMRKVNNIFI